MAIRHNRLTISEKLAMAAVLAMPILISTASAASAATLSVSPSFGGFSPNQTVAVKILVSSPDTSMNAVSGVLNFPPALLSVSSVDKSSSIINLWIQEPSFSNSNGTVSFEGVVLNPGFTGDRGSVLTINFFVKSSGVANLSFSKGSVLANDGNGTQILSGMNGASYTIASVSGGTATTPSPAAGTPLALQISSPTNPDPNGWYNISNPKFTWNVSPDITAVRLLYDKSPLSIPSIVYAPPISEKQLGNVSDGVYYFHAQAKNANGWGAIAHFRFQIDTTPPDKFSIRFVDTSDTTNPTPTVLFNTTDEGSGVDHYKVKIGDRDFFVVSADTVKNNPYTLPMTAPGKQTILVQAFDKAGNYETAISDITVQALPAPVITDYSSDIQPDQIFAVKGKTVPLATVTVWFQNDGIEKNFTGSSDANGFFTITGNGSALDPGNYKMWVEVTDSRKAISVPSDKRDVVVESAAIFRIGSFAISVLTVVVTVAALIALFVLIVWFILRRMRGIRSKVRRESQEASKVIHKEFILLKEKLRRHVKFLEQTETKRELTLEEKKILSELRSEIDRVEKVVEKNLEDIKRDLG